MRPQLMGWKRLALLAIVALFALSAFAIILMRMMPYSTPAPTPTPNNITIAGLPPFDYNADVFFFYSNICPHCHEQIFISFNASDALGLKVQKVDIQGSDEGWNFYRANAEAANCTGVPFVVFRNGHSICGMHSAEMFAAAYEGKPLEGFYNYTYNYSGEKTPTPITTCSDLWFFDNDSTACTLKNFCMTNNGTGYAYDGLHTFTNFGQCNLAFGNRTG